MKMKRKSNKLKEIKTLLKLMLKLIDFFILSRNLIHLDIHTRKLISGLHSFVRTIDNFLNSFFLKLMGSEAIIPHKPKLFTNFRINSKSNKV